MTPPRRILIVRTSALGDIVHGLPVVGAIRKAYPKTQIAWLVEASFAQLLEHYPGIDQLIPLRTKAWRKAPFSAGTRSEFAALRKRLKSFAPDVALDLMGNHKGAALARLSGAKRRIGLHKSQRREPSSSLWINHPVHPVGPHAVERAFSVVQGLDIPTPSPIELGGEGILPLVPEATAREIEQQIDPFVLIHPGAGWTNKELPPATWAKVARILTQQHGLTVRIVTSPFEARQAQEAVELAQGTLTAVDATSLPSLAAWLRAARLVLGGDTGPLHMAHAMGSNVLFVMGPTSPELHGPYGATGQTISETLPCSFCYKRFDSVKACMLNLTAERIAQTAVEELAKSPG